MSPARTLVTALAAGLLLAPLLWPPSGSARARGLSGPLAELAAEVQWLRFEGALTRGEEARALALAESALALAPGSTAGWLRLAAHQGYDLTSLVTEPELARRRAWFAACEVTVARARARAEQPGEIEFFHALLCYDKAVRDPELVSGGGAELLARAEAAMLRAAEHGQPEARELLDWRARHPPDAR